MTSITPQSEREDAAGAAAQAAHVLPVEATVWPDPPIPDFDEDGAMVPPWIKYPNLPRTSMGWRMGAGEEYQDDFDLWWTQQDGEMQSSLPARYPAPASWAGFWERMARVRHAPLFPLMGVAHGQGRAEAPEDVADVEEGNGGAVDTWPTYHNHAHFLKHCEIAALLLNRDDREHPAVKHHIREAVREASNHVAFGPGKGKPSAEFMSAAAELQMVSGNVKGLIAEHVVPVSRLNELLIDALQHGAVDAQAVALVLSEHTKRAVITSAEDDRLRALGLHKGMSEEFEGPLGRYAAAGIDLVPNRYAELRKASKKMVTSVSLASHEVGDAEEVKPEGPRG